MADVHDKATRSFNMSRIKGKNTKPEMLVRRFLHAKGFRYKLHDKMLPGKPDIVLPKYKTVIFVHGCFWHGHDGCKLFRLPKNNHGYWSDKIKTNIDRDIKNLENIELLGWKTVVIWECQIINTSFSRTQKELLQILF